MTYSIQKVEPITKTMLDGFDRRQNVTKRYDLTNHIKTIQDVSFVDDWSIETKRKIVDQFFLSDKYYNSGVYDQDQLIGFQSLTCQTMGPHGEYLELKMLHVDNRYRGKGIGKLLFEDAVAYARNSKAKKLYISAHSAFETQEFYLSLGCRDTEWVSPKAFQLEPYDIHLEYVL